MQQRVFTRILIITRKFLEARPELVGAKAPLILAFKNDWWANHASSPFPYAYGPLSFPCPTGTWLIGRC